MDWHTLQESVPAALTFFGSVVTGAVAVAIKVSKMWRAAQDREMKAQPEVAPLPQPTPATNPFDAPSQTARILQWQVTLARASSEMHDTKEENERLRKERDDIAADASRIAATLAKTNAQLSASLANLANMRAARDQWKTIAEGLRTELEELQERAPTDPPPPEAA